MQPLEIGFASGQDRLLLWLPMTITHVIDETSPLSNWKIPEDALQDADATIVILVYKYAMIHVFVFVRVSNGFVEGLFKLQKRLSFVWNLCHTKP